MINKIWAYFIVIGIIYSLFTNNISLLNQEIINSAKTSLNMILEIFPIMTLWLGLMNIATKSNLLNRMSKAISPVITKIFNEIPPNHKAIPLIATNVIANIFGLGNAATPIGLKAMKELKELNDNKDEASNSMITFLAMNTSGLTLIPTTVISLRILHKSVNPTKIVLGVVIATTLSSICALIIDRIVRKIKHG